MESLSCIVDSRDVLGEGPVWEPVSGRVFWFDIKGRKLHWHAPEDGGGGTWDLPLRCSAAAPRARGGLIVACEAGLAAFDTETGDLELVEAVDLGVGFRSNDGKIDVGGRFWWSSMDDDGGRRPGALFRTTGDGVTEKVLEGIHIPNTVSCSPGGDRLYVADSKLQTLFVHDVDPHTGALSNGRVFADTKGTDGAPDGSAVDVEGYLWNAQWGAWRIVRYAPDGTIDRIVEVPVAQPSSCAFGGPDMATLFVTSAREGLSAEALARQPQAGGLFAFRPGVTGLSLPSFAG
ncbi:MAG: SMP-30/gluconolactonase/LRE family protein [Phenylobacterium sp.]|uniref:SMP-30/gluconolactonase/LRE family protein n=1 Tax=Phenylobacterium sp. TaxID=1871053 RepID=UPI002A361444|nr:SMP-30/gluconolactonase/LRE family protein [Phenylobacterium sp.]MDX9999082.1 SMP-30/gluconolactonase/LRE family protein [Phenylobacterium sp.]